LAFVYVNLKHRLELVCFPQSSASAAAPLVIGGDVTKTGRQRMKFPFCRGKFLTPTIWFQGIG
jgi:hypothetical protein